MPSERAPDRAAAGEPRARSTPALGGASLTVVRADDLLTQVALSGSLDLSGVEHVEPAFNASVTARHRATIVDLSQLHFISSLGLSMLVSAHRAAKLRGRPFVLVGPQPAVLEILRGARLHQVMSIVSSIEEAMALAQTPHGASGTDRAGD